MYPGNTNVHPPVTLTRKTNGTPPLLADLYEMCGFQSRWGKENAVVGDDADLVAVYMCKALAHI